MHVYIKTFYGYLAIFIYLSLCVCAHVCVCVCALGETELRVSFTLGKCSTNHRATFLGHNFYVFMCLKIKNF